MVNKNRTLREIVTDSIGIGIIFHILYSGVTAINNSQPFLDTLSNPDNIRYSICIAAGMGIYGLLKKL